MKLPIKDIKPNPSNPRFIRDDKFQKLVQSLKDFPEMAEVREIVVNKEYIILGGNMRYKAMIEAGWTEAPVKIVDWPEDKQREFMIKDNVSGGEWDWDLLANEWDAELLDAWGLELPKVMDDEFYARNITTPTYEAVNEKPTIEVLIDTTKADELIEEINKSDISDDEKDFLIKASFRHYVFDYTKIADYYAYSSKEVQELMEKSALVIIDYKKAIEQGFVDYATEIAHETEEEFKIDG